MSDDSPIFYGFVVTIVAVVLFCLLKFWAVWEIDVIGGKEFIIDYATYRCVKTNELGADPND